MIRYSSLFHYFPVTLLLVLIAFCCSIPNAANDKLTASFTYSPGSPESGQAVQFTDTSTGIPTSWQWDFGDGSPATVQNPSHTYTAAGSYLVTLTIRSGSSLNNTSKTITVGSSNAITAASPSFADVSTAIASANPGDTVIVPAGTATWGDHLIITKGINMIGAGVGQTVITSNYNAPNLDINAANGNSPSQVRENYLISYIPSTPSADIQFRLSGFTFNCASKCEGILLCNYVRTPWITVRVDHNYIKSPLAGGSSLPSYEQGKAYPVTVWGQIKGVIDSNTIEGQCEVYGMNGNWSTETFQFGSEKNIYFEDNNITMANATYALAVLSSGMGGRWCFRHNTINAVDAEFGLWPFNDDHGNMGSGGNSGVMGFESYSNTVELRTYNARFMDQRGGRGLFYNNNINTTGSVDINVREEYLDSQNPPATASDGETQHVCDSYYWSNTKNTTTRISPTIAGTVNYGGSIGTVPQVNRDFWFQGATFDGTAGMGVGPLASRPATCITGVAYWATDENKLYRATATNVWTLYYTPYPYPHPLRN